MSPDRPTVNVEPAAGLAAALPGAWLAAALAEAEVATGLDAVLAPLAWLGGTPPEDGAGGLAGAAVPPQAATTRLTARPTATTNDWRW